MPDLVLSDFNILIATLGAFISLFGLVSYVCIEKFYLSEAFISTLFGVALSPHAANLIRPLSYAQDSEANLESITLYFSRLVLGVQLVIAGIQLPSRYLKTEWKSLALLLGPGMIGMWLISSLIVWGMVPDLPFLQALAVAACVTPTDPILSNSIVKGKFADKHIPRPLQQLIIAESGSNDGLGYPFLFIALYIFKFNGRDGYQGAGEAMRQWFGETWGYTILMSVAYGALVGYLAKVLLRFCEKRGYVDRESFLVFAIALSLFVVGTDGMLGSDDVLACFIAGNAFTWDDWFRKATEDDSLQPTIDLLLNIAVFLWFGAVCPWPTFRTNDVIPIWRLIILGILIMLFRRLPVVFALHRWIPQIEHWRQMGFVGFFGPIGVSAIFYLYISLDYLNTITVNGEIRPDAARLREVFSTVVWFMCITSIFVHGLAVPAGQLGYHFPRSISRALTISREKTPTNAVMSSWRAALKFKRPDEGRSVREETIGPPSPSAFRLRSGFVPDVEKGDTPAADGSDQEPLRPIKFIDTPTVQSRIQTPSQSTSELGQPTAPRPPPTATLRGHPPPQKD